MRPFSSRRFPASCWLGGERRRHLLTHRGFALEADAPCSARSISAGTALQIALDDLVVAVGIDAPGQPHHVGDPVVDLRWSSCSRSRRTPLCCCSTTCWMRWRYCSASFSLARSSRSRMPRDVVLLAEQRLQMLLVLGLVGQAGDDDERPRPSGPGRASPTRARPGNGCDRRRSTGWCRRSSARSPSGRRRSGAGPFAGLLLHALVDRSLSQT